MTSDSTRTDELMRSAASGDEQALNAVFSRYRERLTRMVRARLNPQLQGRIDASDVVQDAHLEIARRLEEYLKEPQAPLFLWMRSIVGQKLLDIHRRHLGAAMRDANREVRLHAGASAGAESGSLAAILVGPTETPSEAAVRAEQWKRVHEILEDMKPMDREVLVLRHFEQLSNSETAQVLGVSESGATARHLRALRRLKERLSELRDLTRQ